jgi:predicted GTPase
MLSNLSFSANFSFKNPPTPKRILVIGKTGAGKSTFIETVMEQDLNIVGHSMSSCTTEITPFTRQNLTLIDSPVLDDEHGRDQSS